MTSKSIKYCFSCHNASEFLGSLYVSHRPCSHLPVVLHCYCHNCLKDGKSSFCVIEVHKLLLLIVTQKTPNSTLHSWAYLDDKLHICISEETGHGKRHVQGPTEWSPSVPWHLVIESKDGINPSWELGAECYKLQHWGSSSKDARNTGGETELSGLSMGTGGVALSQTEVLV